MPFRVGKSDQPRPEVEAPVVRNESRAEVSLSIGGTRGRRELPRVDSVAEATNADPPRVPTQEVPGTALRDYELPTIESEYEPLLQTVPTRVAPVARQSMTPPNRLTNGHSQDERRDVEPGRIGPIGHDSVGSHQSAGDPNGGPVNQPNEFIVRERPHQSAELRRPPTQPARRYRLRDGDRLTDLARKYLGDENRAGEIWEMNRHVLPHPEVLPLGTEILLPVQ